MNRHLMNPDAFDANSDDLAPMDEIEYAESVGFDTAVEVEPLAERL